MVELRVEVISSKIIKPSSPTPPHLRHHQLSFIDQIASSLYLHNILLFPKTINGERKLDTADASIRLTNSLSDTLTHYYPLAGRLEDNLAVECNDKGVPFLETRVSCHLTDDVISKMQDPDDLEQQKLLPFYPEVQGGSTLLGIQFNVFDCGGVALGICFSHRVGDGLSFAVFMKFWADVCRGREDIVSPMLVTAEVFPPDKFLYKTAAVQQIVLRPISTTKKLITKRFVFGLEAIEALRTKYDAGSSKLGLAKSQKPSRVEALEAFILSRFMASTRSCAQPREGYVMVQTVNLRNKLAISLPVHSFGNMVGLAVASFPKGITEDMDNHELITIFRGAIRAIDMDYMLNLVSFLEQLQEKIYRRDVIALGFTSICGFGLSGYYDFGWDKSVFLRIPGRPFGNSVVLTDSKSSFGGVDAYICLEEEDMSKFEHDEEITIAANVLSAKMSKL